MHDNLMEEEKKSALKDLIRQMYVMMCKDEGHMGEKPEAYAGEETPEEENMESAPEEKSEDSPLGDKVAEAMGEEKKDESDLDPEEKSGFMKRGKFLPKVKGSMVMMKVAVKPKKKGMKV